MKIRKVYPLKSSLKLKKTSSFLGSFDTIKDILQKKKSFTPVENFCKISSTSSGQNHKDNINDIENNICYDNNDNVDNNNNNNDNDNDNYNNKKKSNHDDYYKKKIIIIVITIMITLIIIIIRIIIVMIIIVIIIIMIININSNKYNMIAMIILTQS